MAGGRENVPGYVKWTRGGSVDAAIAKEMADEWEESYSD